MKTIESEGAQYCRIWRNETAAMSSKSNRHPDNPAAAEICIQISDMDISMSSPIALMLQNSIYSTKAKFYASRSAQSFDIPLFTAIVISTLVTNWNSLSLPALLTRRLGPSPPPCQPCEALIFPNYAPSLSTLGHHATRISTPKNHISEPPPKTSPPSPHISIPCERNQSTKLRCAAGSALAGTAALWPGVVLAGAPSRRSLEAPPGDFRSLLLQAPQLLEMLEAASSIQPPPPPLRHRLLLVRRLEMELRRRRL